MQYAIGIELGETRLRIAAVDRAGEIFSKRSLALPPKENLRTDAPEYVADLINETELEAGFPARWLGLAASGAPAPGNPFSFGGLPARLEPLQGVLWNQPPFNSDDRGLSLTNSAQAALFAEHWCGAAVNHENVVLLRVETELQCAVLAGGELLRGAQGRAGLLHHLWLPQGLDSENPDGPTAIRAGRLLSESALVDAPHGFRSYKALIDTAGSGDADAREIWRARVQDFALLCATLMGVVDAEIIIFDGPLATARDLLLKPLHQALEKALNETGAPTEKPKKGAKSALLEDATCPKLAVSTLGAYGAAIGAARHAMLHARLE